MLEGSKKTRTERWVEKQGEKKIGGWLAGISFLESSFFPIPPDPFLMLATLLKPAKWWKYALIVSLFSVLGGLFGYAIGFFFFDIFGQKIIDIYNLHNHFKAIGEAFDSATFVSMFIAAFTPIPYKIFTIAGGFFMVNIFQFIIASIIGRGARFFMVAFIAKLLGKKYGMLIMRIIDVALVILIIGVVLYSLHSFI